MILKITDDAKTWWTDMVKTLGFPIVVCIALMFGGYQIFITFVSPMFAKQMDTIETVSKTQEKINDELANVSKNQFSVVDKLLLVTSRLDDVAQGLTEQGDVQKEIIMNQKEIVNILKNIDENTSTK